MRALTILAIALCAVAAFAHADLATSAAGFVAIVGGASLLWTWRAAQCVRVERTVPERAFQGDLLTVQVGIRNRGRLPVPWLELEDAVPHALGAPTRQVIAIPGRGARTSTYMLRCRRRGLHHVGPLQGRSGDPLGFKHRTQTLAGRAPILIYPRVVPLERLGLPARSALVSAPAQRSLFEDTAQVVGVRDYRPNDSLRRIHWTATARTGSLQVKRYQPATSRETVVFLDLGAESYPVYHYRACEMAISVAASLLYHLTVKEGVAAGLAVDAQRGQGGLDRPIVLAPRSGRPGLMRALDVLARVDPATASTLADTLWREGSRLQNGATAAVVTGRLDDALVRALIHLRSRQVQVAVILVQPGGPSNHGGVEAVGIPMYRVHEVPGMEDVA